MKQFYIKLGRKIHMCVGVFPFKEKPLQSTVLVLGGTELIFFIVSCIVLYFGFVMKAVLII